MRRHARVIVAVFICVLAWQLAGRSLWTDEAQVWLWARGSASIPELLHQMRYDPHPALWHIFVWPFAQLTSAPLTLQLVHGALAVVDLLLLLRLFRGDRRSQALLSCGYFVAFEYAAVARSDALGFTFLLLATLLRRRSWWGVGTLLGLACLTSLPAAVAAFALGVVLVARRDEQPPWKELVALALPYTIGFALLAWQIVPEADQAAFTSHLVFDVFSAAQAIWKSFAPFPRPVLYWGNANLLDVLPHAALVQASLSLVLGGVLLWLAPTRRMRVALALEHAVRQRMGHEPSDQRGPGAVLISKRALSNPC